jgi:hypothetical protein
MIVSVTERGTYKRCRRKWLLGSANGRNLEPVAQVSKALGLGTLVHKSLASWIIEPDASLPELFKGHAAAKLAELNEHYIKVVGAPPSNDEIAPLLDSVDLGLAMMTNYQAKYGSPLPADKRFVAPEQEIHVPIPGTEHPCEDCHGIGYSRVVDSLAVGRSQTCEKCSGTGIVSHILRGTLDGLVQDEHDWLHVLEHKTYGRRPRRETLASNDQFIAYIWILTQLNIGPVRGIAYDGMYKKKGPTNSIKKEDLFLRTTLTRSEEELAEFGIELAAEVNEMASGPVLYKNRRWEGCSDCPFDGNICNAMSRGEDTEPIIKIYFKERDRDKPLGVVEASELRDAEEPY